MHNSGGVCAFYLPGSPEDYAAALEQELYKLLSCFKCDALLIDGIIGCPYSELKVQLTVRAEACRRLRFCRYARPFSGFARSFLPTAAGLFSPRFRLLPVCFAAVPRRFILFIKYTNIYKNS